jgi:hypothetical protein
MKAPGDLLAVLVDADNVPPSRIGAVFAEVARFGTASVKRVYGDWTTTQLSSWKAAASEHVIQPMQQFADEGAVGRLSWSKGLRERTAYAPDGPSPYDFDDGTLYVQHVTVNAAGEVVDCGGYVVPDDYEPSDWPMTPMPDPAERELTITIGVPAPMTRPVPPAGETPPQASSETTTRSGWLRRLLGRD